MSGKLEPDQTRVDLASVLSGALESVRPAADAKQIVLRRHLGAGEFQVLGDGARLQQVFANLLGNAVKFTPAGGTVTTRLRAEHGAAVVVVEDDGEGIAPQLLPRLFERFRQGDSSSVRKHGGLGLGLAIVKHLVALHGGHIRAASEGVGRGARFSVTLPLAARSELARAGSAPAVQPPHSLARLDVLVVEDDEDSRRALELALGDRGARVRTVASVPQALEAYDARPPDVLLSDIGMPGEDGYALIRTIREREAGGDRRTLAIAMTGFAGLQDRQRALRAGFDEHLAKPVEFDLLLDRVRALK
jgi:CheY-like chemotaxis protein/two-component sensor histidine kinase